MARLRQRKVGLGLAGVDKAGEAVMVAGMWECLMERGVIGAF